MRLIGRVAAAVAVALAASAAASCGGERESREAHVDGPAAVRFAVATAAGEGEGLTFTGVVRGRRETALAFNSQGRISAVLVEEGESIRAGQVLARLDGTPMEAAVLSAQAEWLRASSELDRYRRLNADGWLAQPRLETAEAAAAAAQARLSGARFEAALTTVRAPAAGIVLGRHAEPNQMVAPGEPVLTIAETGGGYVLRVPLSDADLARVRLGASAAVDLPALGGESLRGQVIEIGGRADERTGTFEAAVLLPAAPGLRSGLIGRAALTGSGLRGAGAAVPAEALFDARADEGFVYVLTGPDPRVRLRRVRVLGFEGGRARVTGLAPGERVALGAADRLADGAPVKVAGSAA